jgi:hypothetical protein
MFRHQKSLFKVSEETHFLEPWAAARLIMCLLSLFSLYGELPFPLSSLPEQKNDNELYSVLNPQNHLATSSWTQVLLGIEFSPQIETLLLKNKDHPTTNKLYAASEPWQVC